MYLQCANIVIFGAKFIKMKLSILLALLIVSLPSIVIIDFNSKSDLSNWYVVDDGVMGGLSSGNITITKKGYAKFYGDVSLDNNGGFTSVRYQFEKKNINSYTTCKIKVKGDGKNYEFRVKSDADQRHSYKYNFQTSGKWEEIEIPLKEMYPTFIGMKLDIPNFPVDVLEEIMFLIANKKEERFQLLIDKITLE